MKKTQKIRKRAAEGSWLENSKLHNSDTKQQKQQQRQQHEDKDMDRQRERYPGSTWGVAVAAEGAAAAAPGHSHPEYHASLNTANMRPERTPPNFILSAPGPTSGLKRDTDTPKRTVGRSLFS